MDCYRKIGIIGAGCYGTAIAQCLSRKIDNVTLLSNSQSVVSSINSLNINMQSLPGITLSKNISATINIDDISDSDVIFISVPVSAVKTVCCDIKAHNIYCPLILCSKGFDVECNRLLSNLIEEILLNKLAIFSGPSFASELVRNLPLGVNIASKYPQFAESISIGLATDNLRIKKIDDYIGIQVIGAMKNILAVGCGIISGLRLGSNAISYLIVNAMKEITDIMLYFGGNTSTMNELCGVGDIILTCTSLQSRNMSFGQYLASGGKLNAWTGDLAEGTIAASAVPNIVLNSKVQLNIFENIYKAIYEDQCAIETAEKILS